MFNFKPANLMKDQLKGKGSFGKVYAYKTKKHPNGDKWAVKVLKVGFEDLCKALNEVALGFKCDHINILSIKGFYIEKLPKKSKKRYKYKVYMKLPMMEQSLDTKWKEQGKTGDKFPKSQILEYFYGLSCGLNEFHKKKIAHKDIKPENILLDKDGVIKIADIGLAKCLENDFESSSKMSIGGGTRDYLAPEILEFMEREGDLKIKKDAHLKSDLWSLGLTMLDVCLLKKSFKFFWSIETKQKTLAAHIESVKSIYGDQLASLLQGLLQWDSEKRISLEYLVENLKKLFEEPLNVFSIKEVSSVKKDQEEKSMEEELEEKFGENRIISSEKNRKSGEVRDEEIKDYEGRLEAVKKKMKASSYGKLFKIEASERERALAIGALKTKQKSIIDKDLKELFTGLIEETKRENYTRLNNFKLDLQDCQNITDVGIKVLADQIGSHLKNITHLDLCFYHCSQISDSGISEIAAQISSLQSITQLHLNFYRLSKITDSGFKKLSTMIGMLKDITRLYLDFCFNSEITDSGFKELSNQIGSNLKNLNQLELNFSSCKQLTDSGLKELSNQIGLNLKNLSQIQISLACCDEITDVGFRALVTQIGSRPKKITSLDLRFFECKNITDSGLEELTTQIGLNLENLTQLKLSFFHCKQVSESGVTTLATKIAMSLKNITHLDLSFGLNLSTQVRKLLFETFNKGQTLDLD